MSEEIEKESKETNPSGIDDQPSGEKVETVAYDNYKKVLNEKKSFQERLSEKEKAMADLQAKLEAIEVEKLKSKEDQTEYIQKLENQLKETRERDELEKKKAATTRLVNAYKSVLSEENCSDVDDFVTLTGSKLKAIAIDPNTHEPNMEAIRSLVSEQKKERAKWFEPAKAKIDDIQIRKGAGVAISEDMTIEEMQEQIRQQVTDSN